MLRRELRGSARLVGTLLLMMGLATAVAAQSTAVIRGQVLDPEGKPWPGLVVRMANDRGNKAQTVTDQEGRFTQGNLASGKWQVEFVQGERVIWRVDTQFGTGQQVELPVINFKELIEKTPEGLAAKKKVEEEKSKFEGMKAQFDAGVAALQAADNLQSSLAKTPADQKAALQGKNQGAAPDGHHRIHAGGAGR